MPIKGIETVRELMEYLAKQDPDAKPFIAFGDVVDVEEESDEEMLAKVDWHNPGTPREKKITKLWAIQIMTNSEKSGEKTENNVYLVSSTEGGFFGIGDGAIAQPEEAKTWEQMLESL